MTLASDDIIAKFHAVAIRRGNTYWLRAQDAIKLIEEARVEDLKLLGFDAAHIDDTTIRPSLENSWDYTGQVWPPVSDPYEHAIQFLQRKLNTDLYFEIVLSDNNET